MSPEPKLATSDIEALTEPSAFYAFFRKLNYKVEHELGAKPAVFDLQEKYFETGQKIHTIVNYGKLFQVFLVEVKLLNRDTITNLARQIGRHCPFPLIIFTADYSGFVFTFLEAVEEEDFKQKIIRLSVDIGNVYHTDLSILSNCALPAPDTSPRNIFRQLREAFSVEKVTKAFFNEYRALFDDLVAALKGNAWFPGLPEVRKGAMTAENFAKKLLGQIVFLYFIQKKGWLGVAEGDPWGKGDKRFLWRLFEACKREKKNFFDDFLEPLFYDTLNNSERGSSDPSFAPRFQCRIPFLNGGLFEPEYDWEGTRMDLSNDVFENVFSVFEKYNFTVKEDEPLDREVAVDPEMLGKIFENLLPENLRRGKGTYYTPRAIVHYMCQEALTRYLGHETGIEADTLRSFLKREYRQEGKKDALPAFIRTQAKKIDDLLKAIRVVDPAVGSGAFPVGMLHEIVGARMALNVELNRNPSEYKIKRETIERSIYGVDIDPGAVEIAKLRLWLTLVVDHELKDIEPLPNLDYKIMVGNSLFEDVHGVRLFNDEEEAGSRLQQVLTGELELRQRIDEFIERKTELFSARSAREKKKLRKEITATETQIVDILLEDKKQCLAGLKNSTEYIQIEQLKNQIYEIEQEEKKNGLRSKDYFLWKLHFAEVFKDKGGFDVVIANPPYVRQEDIKYKDRLKPYTVSSGQADLYCYFYELGFRLLKENGILSFITSNKYLRANYGRKLRQFFKERSSLCALIDFGDLPVFEATAYPCILIARKGDGDDGSLFGCTISTEEELRSFESVMRKKGVVMKQSELPDDDVWTIEQPETAALKRKIEGTPKDTKTLKKYVDGKMYRGVLTGYNEAFVIDAETRKKLIAEDPKSAEVIKPYLRGKDIKRYAIKDSGMFLIFTRHDTDIERYPAIKKHLSQFKADLMPKKSSNDERGRKPGPYEWYEIQDNIAYWEEFEKPKIVWGNLTQEPNFAFDGQNHYINAPANILVSHELYLLGVLNSGICKFVIGSKAAQRSGGFLEYKPMYVETVPIRLPNDSQRKAIEEKVRLVLQGKQKEKDTTDLERDIDALVYEVYGLNESEIAVIEDAQGHRHRYRDIAPSQHPL